MADTKKLLSQRDEWLLDLDALDPEPRGLIPIPERDEKGRVKRDEAGRPVLLGEYAVYSYMDLPLDTALRVMHQEDDAHERTFAQNLERMREQMKLIAPDIPAEHVSLLSPALLIRIAELSQGRSRRQVKDLEGRIRANAPDVSESSVKALAAMVGDVLEEDRTQRPFRDDGSGSVISSPSAPAPSGGPTPT